jgi:hypothetical protein
METLNTTLPELKDMTAVTQKLQQDGYTHNFKATDDGLLQSLDSEEVFKPEQVKIINFFRFEGMSDPEDNSILYVIETDNGLKGTLVDAYGPFGDDNLEEFIKAVENISKKNTSAAADEAFGENN